MSFLWHPCPLVKQLTNGLIWESHAGRRSWALFDLSTMDQTSWTRRGKDIHIQLCVRQSTDLLVYLYENFNAKCSSPMIGRWG